jgi:hypothetical protein
VRILADSRGGVAGVKSPEETTISRVSVQAICPQGVVEFVKELAV